MSKAILISIKPKYVAKILNGEKTIEIRKTCPQVFKDLKPYEGCSIDVYIYCTKDNSDGYLYYSFGKTIFHDKYVLIKKYDKQCIIGNGKVVAKFTLNRVEEIKTCERHNFELLNQSCLNANEFYDYLTKGKNFLGQFLGYAWHISNLEIFDRPKELSEFYKVGHHEDINDYFTDEKQINGKWCIPLTKAPQSWCYVEVLL